MRRKMWLLTVAVLLMLYGGWTVRGGGKVEDRASRVPRMTCDITHAIERVR